jgi:hypothetical protein
VTNARVLVIGARGYFGGRIVEALRRRRIEVVAGGRERVDLCDPTTFGGLRGADVIVNAADPLAAPPDLAIDHILTRGGPIWIETTGETATLERLLRRRAHPVRAVLVLGMGIFPGMSNLLARAALDEARAKATPDGPACDEIKVGILLSPLSGAGRGMCGQMAALLAADSFWYEGGQRRTGRSVVRGGSLPFASGVRPVLRIGLPESAMLHVSTGVPNVSTLVASSPRAIGPMLLALAALVPSWRWARRSASTIARWLFIVQRAVLMRRVAARAELVAVVGSTTRTLGVEDGVGAGGAAVAAAVAALLARPLPAPGVYLPDELFTADDLEARMGVR